MTKPTKIKPLSARRLRFCQNYISADTDREAAIAAGYSEKSAHVAAARLLKDDNVLAEIARRQEEASKRADIKEDDVIRMLLEDREGARKAKQYGPSVRAAELIGRKFGMFVDKRLVGGSIPPGLVMPATVAQPGRGSGFRHRVVQVRILPVALRSRPRR